MKNQLNDNDKLDYLKWLLNSNQKINTQIAFNIHAQKTQLIVQEMLLDDLKLLLTKNEDPKEKLDVFIQVLQTSKSEIGELYEKYLANRFGKLSPKLRLSVCIRKLAEKFEGKIDFEPILINEEEVDEPWDLPYYLACSYAIETVCHFGYRVINIKQLIYRNGYEMYVEGSKLENVQPSITQVNEKLNALKGLLIWKNGEIGVTTNWENIIEFKFNRIDI